MNEPASPQPKTSTLAIVALVLALFFCVPLLPIVGTILGVVALLKINGSRGILKGQTLAIVAIVIGIFSSVANVGVLAAIAIPNFIRYQLKSKQSEAKITLRQVKSAVLANAESSGSFPAQGDAEWVPAEPCDSGDCKLDPSVNETQPWKDLGITFDRRRYQYRYQVQGEAKEAKLTVEARADLDHDGQFDIWVVSGGFDADGNPTLEGPVQTDPSLF